MPQPNQALPRHLGLILDGNRRWAREHGVPIIEGHRQGFATFKKLGLSLFDLGIEYVSAYVFSTENWQRSKDEVSQLMKLFLWIAKHETQELHKEGVRLRVIGSKLRLGTGLLKALHEAEELTRNNTRGTLLLCLDYGGQQEVVDALKEVVQAGVEPEDITVDMITSHLYASDVPPVDLIIRTSGEQRLSNFMLWRSAYSELMFTKTYWPDLSEDELRGMLDEYAHRQRRFGH